MVAAEELLSGDRTGFHAFVDFIWAKREGRIQRLARKQPAESFAGPGKLKGTHAIKEKAAFWFIYDMSFNQLARVERLSREQGRYPLNQRIDDIVMTDRVDQRWLPENDPRI